MAKVILGMTLSLDGFINDNDGSPGKLYPDFEEQGFKDLVAKTIPTTGAVIMGRTIFDAAGDTDSYSVDYEYQVPIFVLTHNPPKKHPKENDKLTITFLDDIHESVKKAKTAAGDKDVVIVGGANLAQQIINAKLADELYIDIMPIILGSGKRFFENINQEINLKKIEVTETGERTSLKFQIIN